MTRFHDEPRLSNRATWLSDLFLTISLAAVTGKWVFDGLFEHRIRQRRAEQKLSDVTRLFNGIDQALGTW